MAMTKIEKKAQAYLAVRDEDGEKRIVDIERLLKEHTALEIIEFLCGLYQEEERELQSLADKDTADKEIDRVVARMFRLHMAIAFLKQQEIAGYRAA